MRIHLFFGFLFLFLLPPYSTFAEPIRIGVSTALTGDGATWGKDVQNAIEFANAELGGGKFSLVYGDDKCSPKEATTVAHHLVDVEKVDYLIGFPCSGGALAAAPILERAKKLTMVTCASSPKVADAGEYIFRTFPSDAKAAELLFEHLAKKHRSIGILTEESDFTNDLADAFRAAGKDRQVFLILQSVLPGTADLRTHLSALRTKKLDAIFLNAQSEKTFIAAVRQIRELKWEVPIYGAYYPGTPAILEAAAALMEGAEYVDVAPIDQLVDAEHRQIYDRYLSKYGKPNTVEAVFVASFEGFRSLTEAIQSGKDPRAFLSDHEFSGLFGKYRFDSKGEIIGPSFVMKTIRNGKPVVLNAQQ